MDFGIGSIVGGIIGGIIGGDRDRDAPRSATGERARIIELRRARKQLQRARKQAGRQRRQQIRQAQLSRSRFGRLRARYERIFQQERVTKVAKPLGKIARGASRMTWFMLARDTMRRIGDWYATGIEDRYRAENARNVAQLARVREWQRQRAVGAVPSASANRSPFIAPAGSEFSRAERSFGGVRGLTAAQRVAAAAAPIGQLSEISVTPNYRGWPAIGSAPARARFPGPSPRPTPQIPLPPPWLGNAILRGAQLAQAAAPFILAQSLADRVRAPIDSRLRRPVTLGRLDFRPFASPLSQPAARPARCPPCEKGSRRKRRKSRPCSNRVPAIVMRCAG